MCFWPWQSGGRNCRQQPGGARGRRPQSHRYGDRHRGDPRGALLVGSGRRESPPRPRPDRDPGRLSSSVSRWGRWRWGSAWKRSRPPAKRSYTSAPGGIALGVRWCPSWSRRYSIAGRPGGGTRSDRRRSRPTPGTIVRMPSRRFRRPLAVGVAMIYSEVGGRRPGGRRGRGLLHPARRRGGSSGRRWISSSTPVRRRPSAARSKRSPSRSMVSSRPTLVRTRYVGSDLAVDLHVEVDGGLSVAEGHEIAKAVRQKLVDQGPAVADAVVQVEPHRLPALG